jgi:hypothetical protein
MAKEHFIVSEIDGCWIVSMPDGTEVPCPDRRQAILSAIQAASASGGNGNQAQVLTWEQNKDLFPIWVSGRDSFSHFPASAAGESASRRASE